MEKGNFFLNKKNGDALRATEGLMQHASEYYVAIMMLQGLVG